MQTSSMMKNSAYTFDELICYSFIICITMATAVLMSEKYLSDDNKKSSKSVEKAPVDIEMQKKNESKKEFQLKYWNA